MNRLKHSIPELEEKTVEYWTKQFEQLYLHQIGVIKISGKVIQNNLQQFAEEVAFLYEHGLILPIVVGGGPQYGPIRASYAEKSGNPVHAIGGVYATPAEIMPEITEAAQANLEAVVSALEKEGVQAKAMPFETITSEPIGNIVDPQSQALVNMGSSGKIISIDSANVIGAVYDRVCPVVSHIGQNSGELLNNNAMNAGAELALTLNSKKLLVVGNIPVMGKSGIIPAIYHQKDLDKLIIEGIVSGGMIGNAQSSLDLASKLGPGFSVQIAAMDENGSGGVGLARELLSSGSGTLIANLPSPIVYPTSVLNAENSPITMVNLTEQINSSFALRGQKLVTHYLEQLPKDARIYLNNGQGGGTTYLLGNGTTYMCKLFTLPGYTGLGTARGTIDAIFRHAGHLTWRSGVDKQEANSFYDKVLSYYRSIGYSRFKEKSEEYFIYGIGIPEHEKLKTVSLVMTVPKTLENIK